MSLHTVEIQIEEPYESEAQRDKLQQAVEVTLQHQRVEKPSEIVVAVTEDETLHQLNRRHRGVDAPTDVLAFPAQTKSPTPPPVTFVAAPGFPRYVGDIVISFPRAKAQAAEEGHGVVAELQLLVVHGVLHLLGYSDEAEPERARMWQAQRAILDEMGVEVHLPD